MHILSFLMHIFEALITIVIYILIINYLYGTELRLPSRGGYSNHPFSSRKLVSGKTGNSMKINFIFPTPAGWHNQYFLGFCLNIF